MFMQPEFAEVFTVTGSHEVDVAPNGAVSIRSNAALATVERAWQLAFPIDKPSHAIGATGNASEMVVRAEAVADFLVDNPLAWQSFAVLDDLAQALFEVRMPGSIANTCAMCGTRPAPCSGWPISPSPAADARHR